MKTLRLAVIIATMTPAASHADDLMEQLRRLSGQRDLTVLLLDDPDMNIPADYEKAFWLSSCGRLLTPINSSIDHFAYPRCVDLQDFMLRRPRDPLGGR
jgi:hypothetical protein